MSSDGDAAGGRRTQQGYVPEGFSALPTGTRLSDRYAIESVIGAGGFGITYLSRHEALGKPYAIKEHFPRQFAFRDGQSATVRPSDAPTFRWTLDRFLQEGRSLARCRHPSIVGVADVFEAYGTAYMVLEFEDGSSFGRWLERLGRPPSQDEIDNILVPLLDALAYLHSHDMLHRDIAPDNIMIRRNGKPCLIDFGAARQAIAERSQVMSAIVKAGYSPPEQYTTAGRAQGPWTDIYALAGTLYRALTGSRPAEATERQIEDELVPVAEAVQHPEDYRQEFLDAIDAGLRLRPSQRPQSVAEWYEMLGLPGVAPSYLPGGEAEPPSTPSTTPGSGLKRDASSRPASTPRTGASRGASAEPQQVVSPGPTTMVRIFKERDSRLSRYLLGGVLGGAILLFGSNFVGVWQTPGQREARIEAERTAGIKRPGDEQQRIIAERREADRQETQRLALEREAQRKAADDEAARRARDDAARRAAEDAGKKPPAPRPPNLADTDCQTTKAIELIVAACSEIIARFNDFADAYYVRGWALRERSQPERALTDFNKALELAPDRAATISQRALTYARLKEYDKALVDYNRALELEPRSSAFVNDRGLVYLDLKDYKRALADFDQAIAIDPRFAIPYNNRSRAHVLASNDHARAIADLNKAIEINPRYGLAFENRAFSYLDTKDLPKAIADFSTSIEINPRSARALNGRGVAYERRGSRDLAVSDYRRALEVDPNFSVARQNLTRLGEKP